MTITAAVEESVRSQFFASRVPHKYRNYQTPRPLASADLEHGVGRRRLPSRRCFHFRSIRVGRRFFSSLKIVGGRMMRFLTRAAFHVDFAVLCYMAIVEASKAYARAHA